MMLHKIVFITIIYIVNELCAQNVQQPSGITSVAESIDKFTMNLLSEINREGGDDVNIAISPYTIWVLLAIIAEGARENTLRELENVLGLPSLNRNALRNDFRSLSNSLLRNARGVSIETSNTIFTRKQFPIKPGFSQITQQYYQANLIPANFEQPNEALNTINSYVAQQTGNKIVNFANRDDVNNHTYVFMTSTLFFKGEWQLPFNKSATRMQTFNDESGNPKGQVEMMYQTGAYPFALISYLRAFAAELPYGDGDKTSMIILLPRRNEKLADVLAAASQVPFSKILSDLKAASDEFQDEDVEIFLPKFKIESAFNLNSALREMGIQDLFNAETSDLLGMFNHYLFLSRVMQKAVIEVDEEGTVATAASGGSFSYKTTQPKLLANKPFAFFIVDKPSRTILFSGKISNPQQICTKCNSI